MPAPGWRWEAGRVRRCWWSVPSRPTATASRSRSGPCKRRWGSRIASSCAPESGSFPTSTSARAFSLPMWLSGGHTVVRLSSDLNPGVAMVGVRVLTRAAVVLVLSAGAAVWFACSDRPADSLTGPSASAPRAAPLQMPDLRGALAAQRHHTDALLKIPGVVGTAVSVLPDGRVGVQVLLEREGIGGLPGMLDGIPVMPRVTGRIMAFSDPTKRQRPAPPGFSVGHPAITAGTIGARVRDAVGRVYILSNNHVLANSNGATIGDPEYQPGPFDGG